MRFLLSVLFLFSVLLRASEPPPLDPNGPPNDDVKSRINAGLSLSPIVGYDPTFGVLVGGAVFQGVVTPPYSNGSALLYASSHKNVELELHYKAWDKERLFYNVDATFANFFDPYYGEGDRTNVANQIMIDNFTTTLDPSVGYRFDRKFTLQGNVRLRYRDEHGVEGNPSQRVFGTDLRPAAGISVSYDTRDNQIDSHRGAYASLELLGGIGGVATQSGTQNFLRAELDLRYFSQLTSWLVLATQARGGTLAGDGGYLFRFSLGNDTFRGYPLNRFRGDIYYVFQIEPRATVLPWLSFSVFANAGDIADHVVADFNGPLFTKGVGVRVALRPTTSPKRVSISASRRINRRFI